MPIKNEAECVLGFCYCLIKRIFDSVCRGRIVIYRAVVLSAQAVKFIV